MDKELQNLLDNYEQAIYGYAELIIPSIHQIHLLLDYISQLGIQVKKQKEVIDKIKHILNNQMDYWDYIDIINDIEDVLKEVSE